MAKPGKKRDFRLEEPRSAPKFSPKPKPKPESRPVPEPGPAADHLVGGLNAVLAALRHRPRSGRALLVAEGRRPSPVLNEIFGLARSHGLAVKIVPRPALDRLYGREGHQGVLAQFDPLEYTVFEDFRQMLPAEGPALVLALDRVEDPGNLGALMRSALAFGAAGVIIPRERSAALTPAALNAAAGAAEALPLVRVVNLRRGLDDLREMGFWLVGAEGEGERNLFDFDFPERTVVVLGSEGQGLAPLTQKTCDFLVSIPHGRAEVSSLNVSVAGALFLAEYYRQVGGRV